MTEYSPWPGTLRSNTRDVTDEPWTKNNTGREGSPAFGAPSRLRYIHKGISPFLAQYSLLQISSLSAVAATALCVGSASASPPATRPSPAPLMTARRASGRSKFVMVLFLSTRESFYPVLVTLSLADQHALRLCGAERTDRSQRVCVSCHSGARVKRASPESITTIGTVDNGPAPRGASSDVQLHIGERRLLRLRRIAMHGIDPQDRFGFLHRLDVEIDRDSLAVAAHQHAFKHLVAAGVDLLMRHVGRNEDKIAGVGLRHKLQMLAPAHPRPALDHVDDALEVSVMMRAGLGVGLDGHGAGPQFLRAGAGEIDRRLAVHAGGRGHVGIELVARDDADAIVFPALGVLVAMIVGTFHDRCSRENLSPRLARPNPSHQAIRHRTSAWRWAESRRLRRGRRSRARAE